MSDIDVDDSWQRGGSGSRTSALVDDRYREDGPLFRAIIKDLEGRTSDLKSQLKRIIESASESLEAKRAWLDADEKFIDVLRNTPAVQPLFTAYLDDAWKQMYVERERLQNTMQSLLVDPLRKLYEMDIKSADAKRKKFEEESKEYYAYLAKYLSITKDNKKRAENEHKHLAKKRRFDLARFDYYAFLIDLHGGKKEHELLFHLLSYEQKEYTFFQAMSESVEPLKGGLDGLAEQMADASRQQNLLNKERIEKRRWLEAKCEDNSGNLSSVVDESPGSFGRPSLDYSSDIRSPASALASATEDETIPTPAGYIGLGLQEMEQAKARESEEDYAIASANDRRKEGFLFSTSNLLKPHALEMVPGGGWHKYWCVLSGGHLHEYSNWKRQLESHIDPINLRFASVRPARNTDRRFCFEIITPQFQRVYQATSQEEMQSWVTAINKSIESLLSGMNSSSADLLSTNTSEPTQIRRIPGRSLSNAIRNGFLKRSSGHHNPASSFSHLISPEANESLASITGSPERFRWSSGTPLVNSSGMRHLSILNPTDDGADAKLLSLLREDESNLVCADCDGRYPAWCSINLGILLCTDCSGTHRSLGSHVSKVRSLTLDKVPFTPHIVELLRSIGNGRSNAIWAPDQPRRPSTESRETYIKSKYAEKKYVRSVLQPSDELLLESIDNDDIPGALYSIALGAQVNASVRRKPENASGESLNTSTSVPPLSISQALESQTRLDVLSNESLASDGKKKPRYPLHLALLHGRLVDKEKAFPMAEFLLQNGADASIVDDETGHTLSELIGMDTAVDDLALEYLNQKNKARGQTLAYRSSLSPSPPQAYSSQSTTTTASSPGRHSPDSGGP